jgi:hypothetical protein
MQQFDEITYKIIGCAMKVHNTLGNGFQEVIYQRCLAIELGLAGLAYEREKEQAIYYNGMNVGTRRADFVGKYYGGNKSNDQPGRCAPGTGKELCGGL